MKNLLVFAFLVLLLVVPSLVLAPPKDYRFKVTDFPNYYAAAKMMASKSGALIYQPSQLQATENKFFPQLDGRMVPVNLPPFSLPLLLPLALVPPQAALAGWQILLILALATSFIALQHMFNLSNRATVYLGALVAVSGPAWEAIRHCQIAPFLLVSFLACLNALVQSKFVIAALALTPWLLKPHELLPFLLFLLGARKYLFLGYFFLISCFFGLISSFVLGQSAYTNYLAFAPSSWEITDFVNPTIRGQLLRYLGAVTPVALSLSTLIWILALLGLFWCGSRFKDHTSWVGYATLVSMPIGLVTAPHCHNYDLLLLLPSLVILVKTSPIGTLPIWWKTVLVLATTTLLLPIYIFVHYSYLLQGGFINPYFWTLLALSCYVLILATCQSKTPDASA
ncbi:MAG: DUF2029 domain-containing protein [Candidatus Melainabacteria bacterium]|nr:DUF2029 domain-containing protein [Candidatus Melainabacteria bacterium]